MNQTVHRWFRSHRGSRAQWKRVDGEFQKSSGKACPLGRLVRVVLTESQVFMQRMGVVHG
jgi:hypothetical protein